MTNTLIMPFYFWFTLGAIIGSFLAAAIYRLPRKISMSNPSRSFCPSCQQQLFWYDNMPLLSFLVLWGKCRHCQQTIERTYFLVELISAIGTVTIALSVNGWMAVIWYLVLFYMLLTTGFIDARFYMIPNKVLVSGLAPGMILALIQGLNFTLQQSMAAGAAFLLLYLVRVLGNKMLKKESLGWGDIKLGGLLAFFLGFQGFLASLFIAACLAILWVGITTLFKSSTPSRQIPLAPFWAVGVIILIFLHTRNDLLYFSLPFN